jgi:hypothetical protein
MSENKFVSGWLLPRGINVEPKPVLVPNSWREIAAMCGGEYVDVIYNTVGDDDGNATKICAYVDDQGLIKPHGMDDVNHLAMFLLDYTNPIIGDVVVVGAEDGEGNDTDLPQWLTNLDKDLVVGAAEAYNASMGVTLMILQAVEDGIITESEMQEALQLDKPDEMFADLANLAVKYAEAKDEGGLSIIDGLDKLLEEEG